MNDRHEGWCIVDTLRESVLLTVANELEGWTYLRACFPGVADIEHADIPFDVRPCVMEITVLPRPVDALCHRKQSSLFQEGNAHAKPTQPNA